MKTTLRLFRLLSALVLGGSALSALAAAPGTLTVTPSATTYSAAGGDLTLTVHLTYATPISALDFSITTPPGWKYVSATGPNVPQTPPQADDFGHRGLAFVYTAMPGSPASFSFTVSYPAGMSGSQALNHLVANFTDEATSRATPVAAADITLTPAP